MKIINNTDYQTKDLKKIFIECCKTKLDNWKYLIVDVNYSSGRWIHGKARYGGGLSGGGRVWIFLPRNPIDKEYIDGRYTTPRPYAYLNFKRALAWVFIHELHHVLGKTHKDMKNSYYLHWRFYDRDPEKLSWVDYLPLEKKEVKVKPKMVKPKMDLQLKRYEHVLAALKIKKSQLKRLQNQIKKWTRKKNYYESVLLANGKLKEEK